VLKTLIIIYQSCSGCSHYPVPVALTTSAATKLFYAYTPKVGESQVEVLRCNWIDYLEGLEYHVGDSL
jgi:hypothetical protein